MARVAGLALASVGLVEPIAGAHGAPREGAAQHATPRAVGAGDRCTARVLVSSFGLALKALGHLATEDAARVGAHFALAVSVPLPFASLSLAPVAESPILRVRSTFAVAVGALFPAHPTADDAGGFAEHASCLGIPPIVV